MVRKLLQTMPMEVGARRDEFVSVPGIASIVLHPPWAKAEAADSDFSPLLLLLC
jgi:hypothetical protein